jgi:hypothetical protein
VDGVVFLEMTNGSVALFDLSPATGAITDRLTGARYGSTAQVIGSKLFSGRVPAYLLDSGSFAGVDNAWCHFKCSGCYRPLQASRWYQYDQDRYKGMRKPQNSLGRFVGSRGTEMDDANLRPYRPAGFALPAELSDGRCWHQGEWLGVTCDGLASFYGISATRFV